MKYPLHVSGASNDRHYDSHSRTEYESAGVPIVRRFPPVIQFLTRCEQFVETHLQAVALRTFQNNRTTDQICAAIYEAALSMGYIVTIGVQEVYSSNMPSFPNQTVMSCLLMIDFQPAGPKARS